ncbi:MAG: DNA internalization-related competence protein ComEC/Rec2 [Lachnospiraceae bacterium]|nr:DNA internalization-related competence protein ComEC/Rec2 [Lachnospiraceae bacterium]
MEKRALFDTGLLFLLGILTGLLPSFRDRALIIGTVVFLLAAVILPAAKQKGKRKRRLCLLFFVLILAFFAGLLRISSSLSRERLIKRNAGELSGLRIQGEVEKKTKKTGYIELVLKDCFTEKGSSLGRISMSSDREFPIGAAVIFTADEAEIRRQRNDGGFDERTYLRSKSIFLKLKNPDFEKVLVPAFSPGEWLYHLRSRISAFYTAYLPGEEGGVLSAMALGDKAGMDSEVKDLFSAAGIAHLLAVSGLHISLVAMSLYKLLRKCRLPFAVCFAGAVPGAFFYAELTGFTVSGERALIMFIIYLFSQVVGEAYDMLTSLAAALIIILLKNPFALYDAGFIFSFGAVFVVAAFAGPVTNAYEQLIRYRHRTIHGWEPSAKERLSSALFSSAVVCFGTIPLVASFYYIIPTYQILLNALLIPLMSILLPTALLGGFLSLPILLLPSHFIIYLYEWSAALSLKLPLARIVTGKPDLLRMALYYSCYYILIRLLLKMFQKLTAAENLADTRTAVHSLWAKYLPLAMAMAVFLLVGIRKVPSRKFSFTMVDVGQGDGLYLGTPSGTQIFIDGGSTDEKELGKYTILPFLRSRGIAAIDYWFISHTDADHLTGAVDAMEDGYRVKHLVFAEGVVKNENFEKLNRAAELSGTEILYMKKGDVLTDGKGKNLLTLTCLYAGDSTYEGDTNANCLALWLAYDDLSMPLWGDLGEEQEELILSDSDSGNYLRQQAGTEDSSFSHKSGRGILCLKCNHHGSKGSNCEDFLDVLQPNLAIASAGEGNSYGHPNKETKERLSDRGIPLYCTIECGEIDLSMEDGSLQVRCPYRKS